MELTWLGTAGFILKAGNLEFAFDPFLSRGPDNQSPFNAKSFQNTRAIYVGHGHFDHTYDIPEIVKHSDVEIVAPGLTGFILRMRGVPANRIKTSHNDMYLLKDLKMRAFKSSHVRFDAKLVLSTMKRCGFRDCLNIACLGLGYPEGLVQSYSFEFKGKRFLYLSTAGCTESELKLYRDLEVDYMFSPLQGHSRIQSLVADQIAIVAPKVVIPHHYDDFYPPLSQTICVDAFEEELKKRHFKGKLQIVPLFETVQI